MDLKSLLKRPEGKNDDFPWHPDFRYEAELPEVKSLRTTLLYRALALIVPLLLGFYFYQGYRVGARMDRKVVNQEQSISAQRKASDEVLKLEAEFVGAQKRLGELLYFYNDYLDPIQVIQSISEVRPDSILFDRVVFSQKQEYRESEDDKGDGIVFNQEYSIEGNAEGTYNDALNKLNKYKTDLSRHPLIEPYFKSFNISQIERNDQNQTFRYAFSVTLSNDGTDNEREDS